MLKMDAIGKIMNLKKLKNRFLNIVSGIQYLPYYFQKHIFLGVAVPPLYKGKSYNWGDDVSIVLAEILAKEKIIPYKFSFISSTNYLCIGSIIQWYSNKKAIIWGAGLLHYATNINKPYKVLAVRGPLTRQCLLDNGIQCPEIYGDPALLFPLFYQPINTTKKYQIGIICHYSELKKTPISFPPLIPKDEILFINISHYSKWTDFIDQICQCQCIISSSLHGLIISDAYRVPNIWTSFSNNLKENYDFKFQDYFLSVNKRNVKISMYTELINRPNLIEYIKNKWIRPQINLEMLLSVCPFKA